MNITKHASFFNPMDLNDAIHIIGCGAIGSTLAEMMVRMGCTNIYLYDFDTVSPHNLANQMFREIDIAEEKTMALSSILIDINADVDLTTYEEGYTDQPLSGYVFLCVDNIDLRRKIATENKFNTMIKAMFDFRMRLSDAQHYAADWSNRESIETFLKSMQFTHEEAKAETPTNACGTSMNIITTVRIICSVGLANWINFVKESKLKKMILIDSFAFIIDAF